MAAPPDARLVASLRCTVEPLVHTPEPVHSARIRGICVVDDTVLEDERAHARRLARVRRHVRSGHGRHPGDRPLATAPSHPRSPLVALLAAFLTAHVLVGREPE